MSKVVETDVLVVGAGVAGLTASAFLARQEVSAITVSKYPSTANGPRAHITNQRTMEVMRDLGVEEHVYQRGQIISTVPDVIFTTTLADRELGRVRSWGSSAARKGDYEASSPTLMVNIAQHRLEPIIQRRAVELGADMRFLTELVHIAQDDDGVTATMRYRPTGDEYQIRAQYALAADGGRSTVAEQLGFDLVGEDQLGFAINAWIEADLSRYVAHRPGVLYYTNYPGRDYFFGSGAFALVQRWNEWLVQFSYDPSKEDLEMTEEAVIQRVHLAIGDDTVPVKIKGLNRWDIKHIVASEYQKGRVFLAGDAAHRHPPANGLGSNTSIQDAYNLAWKLATVVKGIAAPKLLESYNSERQPVGRQIIDRAIASVPLSSDITRGMGIVAGQSEAEGWSALDAMYAPTAQGAMQRAATREAFDAAVYGVNGHGVEMGQRYTSDAVIDDGQPWPPYDKDAELYYHPTTHPGAYLPHVWVDHKGSQVSTLDITVPDGWTLIVGHAGERWAAAAKQVGDQFGVTIVPRAVGLGLEYNDVYLDWLAVRGTDDSGCLLVRPDRHITFRAANDDGDPTATLQEAFSQILGKPIPD